MLCGSLIWLIPKYKVRIRQNLFQNY